MFITCVLLCNITFDIYGSHGQLVRLVPVPRGRVRLEFPLMAPSAEARAHSALLWSSISNVIKCPYTVCSSLSNSLSILSNNVVCLRWKPCLCLSQIDSPLVITCNHQQIKEYCQVQFTKHFVSCLPYLRESGSNRVSFTCWPPTF